MCRSKTLAEQRAYEISARPDCKWKLATICPAIVQGPPAGNFLPVKLLLQSRYPTSVINAIIMI